MPPTPDRYDITIPLRTPTLNQLLRTHWSRRRKMLAEIAWYIRAEVKPPAAPFARARVTVHRYSPKALDDDGAKATCKHILDALQPRSDQHPQGLGFIAGDDPARLELVMIPVKSDQVATRIVIERLPC